MADILEHNFTSTWNNYKNGAYKYYKAIFLSNRTMFENDINIGNFTNITLPSLNFTDLSLIGLYRNILEPQVLKDIQTIIGFDETYLYIAKNTFYGFFNNFVNKGFSVIYFKSHNEINKIILNTASSDSLSLSLMPLTFLEGTFLRPVEMIFQKAVRYLLFGPMDQIKIKNLINKKIHSDAFLALHLSENEHMQLSNLEHEIKSILNTYSDNTAKVIMLSFLAAVAFKKQDFIISNPFVIAEIFADFVFKAIESTYNHFVINAINNIENGNSLKGSAISTNIYLDNFNLKKTIHAVGINHLSARTLQQDKQIINLSEEKEPLDIFNTIFNSQSIRSLLSTYLGLKHCIKPNTDNAARLQLFYDFSIKSNLLRSEMSNILSLFIEDIYFNRSKGIIKKVIDEIENYSTNIHKNTKSYQNNDSSKLIISNLKVDIVSKNLTMIDFSHHHLDIDLVRGKHYLMQGQNSIGKSLILKLIIGFSGGLDIKGSISYPKGLSRSDIFYIIQDDYVPYYKPLLHRLSAPKLLPVDKISIDIPDGDTYLSQEDFDKFVDYMSNLLFEIKYEPDWKNVDEAKKSLLDNYNSYAKLISDGDKKSYSIILQSTYNLTGGQLKKLAIANAIYTKPKFLILDESFNAIDEKSKNILYREIEKYLPNSTVLALQHQVAEPLLANKKHIDRNEELKNSLNKILDIAKNNDKGEIIDGISELMEGLESTSENRDSEQENLSFFHEIITMIRSQDENGNVITSFTINNLQDKNEHLISFSPNEEHSQETCPAEIDICGQIPWQFNF